MENRYQKIVLEADKDITFEVLKGTSGELIIKAMNNAIISESFGDYENPPIPEGYQYVEGKWNEGFVIEREADGSQFVWIPVGSLDPDGTLDDKQFTEKFGRRNYRGDTFSRLTFHEPLNEELSMQVESVKKYGGFYISRFNISKSMRGIPQSVKGVMPWVNVNFEETKRLALNFEVSDTLRSHLVYASEYDSVLAWFIKSGKKTLFEITNDSSDWGNYCGTKNSVGLMAVTGSNEEWCVNNIYDFAGNVDEWTQEEHGSSRFVTRGGNFNFNGENCPAAYRAYRNPYQGYDKTGFRVVLCIK